jgi:hypothetical protein
VDFQERRRSAGVNGVGRARQGTEDVAPGGGCGGLRLDAG